MSIKSQPDPYHFEISLSVLNHLGRNLYRNFITVLGEVISNSWDADAKNVWIAIDRENHSFSIKDDGVGMTSADFQDKFLKIGYSKRKEDGSKSQGGRPYIGAKGIGKLALLSCAKKISVFSKTNTTPYVGCVIDNEELDKAILGDKTTGEHSLQQADLNLVDKLQVDHTQGTIICFQDSNEQLRNSDVHIKKLLALNFQFSLLDKEFTIYVNDEQVTIADLKDLSDATQFLWNINKHSNEYIDGLDMLERSTVEVKAALDIKGFIASVKKPSDLKISKTNERATIDLFVNGRLREKNIIRHIPTQRIAEGYIYGQIHFDTLDRENVDPFTSSREGILESDEKFRALIGYLKRQSLPQLMGEWVEFRRALRDEGDDENP